jgi:uncharacterized protein (DUF1810 family)
MAESGEDPFNLQRFVDAQAANYECALAELRAGRKSSHWIWYVFPQLAGLGVSHASQFYSLADLDEARAYLAHPLLGPRLRESVEAMLANRDSAAEDVLGVTDAMKFRSSMTFFARAAPEDTRFAETVTWFFGDEEDQKTLRLLKKEGR